MSKIDELIEKFCPEGVPTKALEEAGYFFSGLSGKSKADFESGNAPFVTYLDIGNNPSLPAELLGSVRVQESERQNRIGIGDLLFTGSSEDREGVGLTSEVGYEPAVPTYLNSFCFGFRPVRGLFARGFLKHLMRSDGVRIRVIAASNGVTRINISKKQLAKVEIAVPPLELQKEIVSILDKFTQLEAELEAELEARRTQYEVTRDRLLDFSSDPEAHPLREMTRRLSPLGVRHLTLSELLGTIPRGRRLTKSALPQDGSIPVFHGGLDPIGFTDQANTPAMTVMVINVGASAGTVGWSQEPFWCSDGCFALPNVDSISPRFLYYCAAASERELVGKVRKAGIPTLDAASVLALKIPVPPLEVQKEIVSILDKLDALVNHITIGLPAEIAARRRQYEYYRNKLLTFKELDAA